MKRVGGQVRYTDMESWRSASLMRNRQVDELGVSKRLRDPGFETPGR